MLAPSHSTHIYCTVLYLYVLKQTYILLTAFGLLLTNHLRCPLHMYTQHLCCSSDTILFLVLIHTTCWRSSNIIPLSLLVFRHHSFAGPHTVHSPFVGPLTPYILWSLYTAPLLAFRHHPFTGPHTLNFIHSTFFGLQTSSLNLFSYTAPMLAFIHSPFVGLLKPSL